MQFLLKKGLKVSGFEHETFFRNKQHRNPIYKEHWMTGMVLLVSFISEMSSLFPSDYCKIHTNYILDEILSRSMRSLSGLNTAWPFLYKVQKHCILMPTTLSEMLVCSTKNKDYRSLPSWVWWSNSQLLPCPETPAPHCVLLARDKTDKVITQGQPWVMATFSMVLKNMFWCIE